MEYSSDLPEEKARGNYLRDLDNVMGPIYGPLSAFLLGRLPPEAMTLHFLDLGGGTGQWLETLASMGVTKGILVEPDVTKAGFASAKRVFKANPHLGVIGGVAEDLPLRDGTIGSIVSRNSMHLWQDIPLGWREMSRVLRPRGIAFIGRGFGPTLSPDIRQVVKEARKKLFSPDREEADSPPPARAVEMAQQAGFQTAEIIPDGKSYWVWAIK